MGLIPLSPEQLKETWTSNESYLDQGLEHLEEKGKKKKGFFFFFFFTLLYF